MNSFLLEVREVVKATPAGDKREVLHLACDRLDKALTKLWDLPSREHLQEVNGMWALTERILKIIRNPEPPAPLARAPKPARLAA